MPSPKSHSKMGHEKNKKGRLAEKALLFHGRGARVISQMLPRPRTLPDLLEGRRASGSEMDEVVLAAPRLTKLLLNMTIQRSPGPVHVLISPEAIVEDLISAAIRQYVKEARQPVFSSTDASAFEFVG